MADETEVKPPSFADAIGSFVDQTVRLAAAERDLARQREVEVRYLLALQDEMVSHWHAERDLTQELHEYLGMTEDQYDRWVKEPVRWTAFHGAAWFEDRFPTEGDGDVPASE